jgi:iron(III) transport system ATP-binding protein
VSTIELRGLTKRYGDVVAVNAIDLDVHDGEFLTLLGPSGCGKTTTLRMIAGLLRTDGGTVTVGGRVLASDDTFVPPEKRAMGMVFQSYAIWPHMSVERNVAYGLRLQGVPRKEITKRVEEALALVQMDGLGSRYPTALSGGQQQRVALARSLAIRPSILLLDEPLSNLDAKLREVMRFELKEIQQATGVTTVYVTHDQGEAMALSDRVVVMNHGNIEQVAPPGEVYHRPRTRFVANFIGVTNFIEGEVVTTDPVTMRLEGGEHLEVTALDPVREGDRVTVSVRPEDVGLLPDGEGEPNTFPAQIARTAFLGSYLDHEVKALGETLRIQTDWRQSLRSGDPGFVHFAPDRCVIVRESVAGDGNSSPDREADDSHVALRDTAAPIITP